MHFHQPGHQIAVGLVETVLTAEALRIDRAQLGMVAAAALGDIVKQRGQIEQLRLVEGGDQPAGERKFANDGTVKRRMFRSTVRMCSSTV